MICDVLKIARSSDTQNATAPTPSGAAVTLHSLGEGQAASCGRGQPCVNIRQIHLNACPKEIFLQVREEKDAENRGIKAWPGPLKI